MNKKLLANILRISIAAALLLIMGAICLCLYIYTDKYGLELLIDRLREFVDSLGIWGILFMLAVQTVQVILAFIPGEPIEIAAGTLYGTVGGTLLCLAGIAIGTFVIFLLVKKLGKSFVMRVIGSDKYAKLKFLKDPAKRDILIFFLMFIPGTPKDVLTYFSPLAGISMWRFILIAAIARIPSVISSTYVGGILAEGRYLHSATVFLVVGAISICGIILYNKIIEAKKQKKEESSNGQ